MFPLIHVARCTYLFWYTYIKQVSLNRTSVLFKVFLF